MGSVATRITIDESFCNRCGLCTSICHEYCIGIIEEKLQFDFRYCSTCGQCIAVCPEKALSWDTVPPISFDKTNYPSPIQLDELFKERRTIRDFKKEKIDRAILEQIVSFASYAPTHNFNFRAIIIDDPEVVGKIEVAIYRFTTRLYWFLYKPKVIQWMVRFFAPKSEFEYLKAKPKLEKSIERGKAFKTSPAAIVMIVGEKRIPLSLESAQYALYNIDLYAQALGLACRNLVGNQMILNQSKTIRNLLKIRKDEKIYGTIALGHPSVKFRNKVVGKEIPIKWN
jgi:ferredoxin